MTKYTTVLFDADATLFDFKRSEHEAVVDCLTYAGLPADDSVVKKYSEINEGYWKRLERGEVTKEELFSARWKDTLEYYGYDFSAEAMGDMYLEKLSEKAYLIEGAADICRELFGHVRLYIVTNGYARVQHKRFDSCELLKFFDGMFISEEMGAEKPSREYFDAVFARIPDIDKDKTVIIGDSLSSDIKGGINAGIDTCWYNPMCAPAPDGMNITHTITELSQIKKIVF